MTYIHQPLVRDRSLILSFDESLRSLVGEWTPSLPEESADDHPRGASIRVDRGSVEPFDAHDSPTLVFEQVNAWLYPDRGFAALASRSRDVDGIVNLRTRVATVIVAEEAAPAPSDVNALLTITAAMLLDVFPDPQLRERIVRDFKKS